MPPCQIKPVLVPTSDTVAASVILVLVGDDIFVYDFIACLVLVLSLKLPIDPSHRIACVRFVVILEVVNRGDGAGNAVATARTRSVAIVFFAVSSRLAMRRFTLVGMIERNIVLVTVMTRVLASPADTAARIERRKPGALVGDGVQLGITLAGLFDALRVLVRCRTL